MNDPKVKRQVWVKHYSLDLREGSPDYILLSLHPHKGKPHRITIPVALVNEITEAMKSLANEHQPSLWPLSDRLDGTTRIIQQH